MIYNDRERLGLSILLSMVLCLGLFFVFDYLTDLEFPTPQIVRPPLLVSFYAERPAPKGEETREKPAQRRPPPQQKQEPVSRQPRSAESPSSSTESARAQVRHDDAADDYVQDLPPVDWGDSTDTNDPYIPEENVVEYDQNAPVSQRSTSSASPVVEIEEDTSWVDERLAKIADKDISSTAGNAGSTADSEGTNPSSIYSDNPVSLDEITSVRALKESPRPDLPDNFTLDGQTEIRVEISFEITQPGRVVNLQFDSQTGYPVLERAIRDALAKWRFVAAPPNAQNMKVRMVYRVRAR
ncbi:MAG: TonB family protein [Spirochaetales bacterium]|nr:TonB family protein [Spirochaetales bacterium]